MDFSTIVLLFIVILNIGLASLILINNTKELVNRFFGGLIISITLWMTFNYFANFVSEYTLLYDKLTFLGAALVGLFLLYFSIYFPKREKFLNWWQHLLALTPFIFIFYLIFFTKGIIAGITIIPEGTGVEQGNLYIIWPIYFISYICLSFYNLIYKFFHSEEKQKKQIGIVFIGLFLSIIIAATTNLIFPLVFQNDNLSNFGPYSTLLFILFTSYAIVRYQLMDIKVIATETLVVVINIGLLFNALFADSLLRSVVGWSLVVFGVLTGYLLIKSVIKEIQQKEQLQDLTTQLAQANAHLQELDKMKTEFVSLASHELLTPVSAIEGYLSMVIDEKLVQVKDAKLSQYLDRIYKSAKRLARLIADMLNISRIEEGRLLVEKKETELSELIKQIIDEIKFKAEERKQKIVYKDHQHLPTYADPDKVKEVLVNIIGNAIKYSKDPGTITIWVERVPTSEIKQIWEGIEESLKSSPLSDQEAIKSAVDPRIKELLGENQYLIRVKDEGIGIPKEELPKLFKKFHRVGDFSTAESQGTGLGLYISRALIELNHGRIWADSEGQGKGSTFSFTLPELACKKAIDELEAEAPQPKEQLKPLARPSKAADEL